MALDSDPAVLDQIQRAAKTQRPWEASPRSFEAAQDELPGEQRKQYEKSVVMRIQGTDDMVKAAAQKVGFLIDGHAVPRIAARSREPSSSIADLDEAHVNLIDVFWHMSEPPVDGFGVYRDFQRVNQFPGLQLILRKDQLYAKIERMVKMFPREYQICPQCWLFPEALNS